MGMWIRGQGLSIKARNIGPNEQWWFLSIKNVAVWACISETFSKGVESVEDPLKRVFCYSCPQIYVIDREINWTNPRHSFNVSVYIIHV